jgi:hypothetical protein
MPVLLVESLANTASGRGDLLFPFTAHQFYMVLALLKKANKTARHLSWSNHDWRSQIGRVEDHERADEGDLLG